MNIYTPYTYLIGWTQHNKWYYGVRFAKGCHPSQFWKNYFTSSKYVKFFREQYGEPDVIQIRHTFSDDQSAREWEQKVLAKMNVVSNDIWLNRSNGKTPSNVGRTFTQDHINKIRIGRSGYTHSDETKRKLSEAAKGRVNSKEHNNNISKARKGIKFSEDHINKWKESMKRYRPSEETKRKMSEAQKKRYGQY